MSAVSEETCNEVESLVFDLFANLGATGAFSFNSFYLLTVHFDVIFEFDVVLLFNYTEEQLDFPVLYASAKEGWASSTFTKGPAEDARNMSALLDAIVKHVPPPNANLEAPFQMLVSISNLHGY